MTSTPDALDMARETFVSSMTWSDKATEDEKTLVLGNLNGFVGFLRNMQRSPLTPTGEEYLKTLKDAAFVIEAMRVQMLSWEIEPVVDAKGIEARVRALVAHLEPKSAGDEAPEGE